MLSSRMKHFFIVFTICLFLTAALTVNASADQVNVDKKKPAKQTTVTKSGETKDEPIYRFAMVNEVKHTSIKNQASTGTCWSFGTLSFLEAELLRIGKEEIDLSEMFVVRQSYPVKALNYFRMHGMAKYGSGGQSHDVFDVIKTFGIVPESAYTGQVIDEPKHNHGEMSAVLRGMLDAVLKRKGKRVTPRWMEAYKAALDIYLGKPPATFTYKGKEYTPKSFAEAHLPLNLDDYIEITSYSHHPFYTKIRLEIPDNWTYNPNYYNVPIDHLEKIADHALQNGYTLVWDGDVSENAFLYKKKKDFAVVPDNPEWEDLKRADIMSKIKAPVKEKIVTQELRQKTFDNMSTTDDHLMHMVGIAKDQNGQKFYLIKNSWGTKRGNKGYIYMSRAFFRLKTIAITVNKNALPKKLLTKFPK